MNTYSIREIALESGHSRDTITRKLKEKGIAGKDGRFTLKDILTAFSGDYKAERTRETMERANLLEIERRQKQGELMDHATVMAIFNAWGLPVRQKLTSLSAEMKHRCNPADPDLAGKALSEWATAVMRQIQAEFATIAAEVNQQTQEDNDAPEGSS